jgi:hypothetical protein
MIGYISEKGEYPGDTLRESLWRHYAAATANRNRLSAIAKN